VTADTVIDGENSVIGWNRYAYCKNNPIIYKDPSGHETIVASRDIKDFLEVFIHIMLP
jgi:hypothetical protein